MTAVAPEIRTFTGTYEPAWFIARGTNPWVEVDGVPVDWMEYMRLHPVEAREEQLAGAEEPGFCTCASSPIPGALEAMDSPDGIQRCDECSRFAGDLDAAHALAQLVGGVVRFEAEPAEPDPKLSE